MWFYSLDVCFRVINIVSKYLVFYYDIFREPRTDLHAPYLSMLTHELILPAK